MDYGLNIQQLRVDVVRPVLQHLGLHSVVAENLVLGTALVESLAGYLRQVHDDIWNHYLRYNTDLESRVSVLLTPVALTDGARELIGNLYYGAAMCRVHYRRVLEALPINDAHAMAYYWKQYYNTPKGKGTIYKAVPHFEAVLR
jgi:hypothetical protein